MRLKEKHEFNTRKLLSRFSRWAWVNEAGGASPLSRLFSQLAIGKSATRIAVEIQKLAISDEVRNKALLLLAKTKAYEIMDDRQGERIDMALTCVLVNGWGDNRAFVRQLVDKIYMENGRGSSLAKITRDMYTEATGDHLPARLSDFPTKQKNAYNALRRFREVFEADFYFAYECVLALPITTKNSIIASELEAFCERYYVQGCVDTDALQVKERYLTRDELVASICKVV